MAHSNEYLSVIYTGSIVLFTLALKGAREIEFRIFNFQIPSRFLTRDIFFFDRSSRCGDEETRAMKERLRYSRKREREREREESE
mgnify:CR=1 FL=1